MQTCSILAPGRNCWRIEQARRAAVLVDAANYFERLEQSLKRARRSILIMGWDFDGRITLRRGQGNEDAQPLGQFLRSLVEAQPELEVRILVWSVAVLHAPGDPVQLVIGADWQDHPRIQLRLDTEHQTYAAQHQKIVCIDDSLAFCGGIDLTVDRWDTTRHEIHDSRRRTPDGESTSPVHDMQMVLEGDAACALADFARHRWQDATGEVLKPVGAAADLWPRDLEPDFTDATVGVSRTVPARNGAPPIREAAQLAAEALSAARRTIYIEAQYLASSEIGDVLAKGLAREDGPEIVIITTLTFRGILERVAMGTNRDRLIRRLRKADRFDRLRVYHPVVGGPEGDCEILIHAKLIIIDDDLLRIGSSNLNNRSIGLDTECDVSVEALRDDTRRGIARVRERLLAEHLGADPDQVARTVAAEGSLVRAVEKLNTGSRALRLFTAMTDKGPTRPVPGTRFLDPRSPFKPFWFLRRKRGR